MFTPKLQGSSRAKASPFTPGRSVGGPGGRRRSTMFTPQSQRIPRTPVFTPGGKGRNTSLNQSVVTPQGSFMDEGTCNFTSTGHALELFGATLPISISETVRLSDSNANICAKLDPSGWAWLVSDRKLLVWFYKPTDPGKVSPCRELDLPLSETAYTSELIAVLPHPGEGQVAACVAVSAEGIIRYWPNVAHETSFVETSAETKGEKCAAVVPMQSFHCILATSTNSLLLLTPAFRQSSIKCRMLKTPQGMLSGIGRRMSSLFFGAGGAQTMGEPMHRLLAGEMLDTDVQAFYVLSGNHLQKWALMGDVEKLLYQCHTEDLIKDCAAQTIWNQDCNLLHSLKTWPLDMQVTRDGVVILAAALNPEVNNTLHYCFGTLHTEGQDPPQSFLSFTVTKFSNSYLAEDEPQLFGYQLLLPDSSSSSAYIYDKHQVVCLSVSSSSQPMDKVEFHTPGDRLLGAGYNQGFALFFSVVYGIVSLRDTSQPRVQDISVTEPQAVHTTLNDVSMVGNPEQSKIEELSVSEDVTTRLKAAFLSSISRNLEQSQQIVDQLFPASAHPSETETNSLLDSSVSRLSEQMIDDYPASDPRWAESVPHDGAGTSSSVILLQQLDDKLKAHEYYIQFLTNVGLWNKLNRVTVHGSIIPTQSLLCEHAEKVVAAKALRNLHARHPTIIDKAVEWVLRRRQEEDGPMTFPSGLTHQDIFYREVSKIEDILLSLQEYEEEELSTGISPREVLELVQIVNLVFGGMLYNAHQYRESKAAVFKSVQGSARGTESMSWTSSGGPKGLRTLLERQHTITVKHALSEARDPQERGHLFQQLLELTDILLHGYRDQLEAARLSAGDGGSYTELVRKYEQSRSALISPFLQHEQYARAASLAEKYCDFAVLVQICEATANQDRLQRYMNQFQANGFSDFVFEWYVNEGKRGKLMSSSLAAHPQLSRFLQTGENRFMSWLHDISANNYYQAHSTLLDLAREEKKSAAKKKTLLSLSKLAAMAADDPPDAVQNNLDAISEEQDLLIHQEQLPEEVLERLCLDVNTMQVLTPRELIQYYVSDYNEHASEFDFKKALDLLPFINKNDPEQDYEGLLLHIWCQALLHEQGTWSNMRVDDPLANSRDTLFYRTLELVFAEGAELTELFLTSDRLLNCEELGPLQGNRNFQFQIKAIYEQIQRFPTAS